LKRKDKVINKLIELTQKIDKNDSDNILGFDANFIGGELGIDRTNTSKDLNQLYNEGHVIKIKSKPVLFFHKKTIDDIFGFDLMETLYSSLDEFKDEIKTYECGSNKKIISKKSIESAEVFKYNFENTRKRNALPENIFDSIIGHDKSLKEKIDLAKAAVLYPPMGIHTLIVGPTGTGKSTFAEYMYRFAIESKKFKPDSPMVVFNCADYYDNPQLLISQIFGHSKGAYTGADKEKKGLIDYADGGILFLDEIHRLPPEGQEMLFLLIDKGTYRRLGESESNRKAEVLIIAATTEDPKSVMLETFLRRIPALIELPSLDKRTREERIQLICRFFIEEAKRIGSQIKVTREVLMAFIFYDCPGNIGQLKSDVQLICARAFLDFISYYSKQMEVKLSHLSKSVQKGLYKMREKKYNVNEQININLNEYIIFNPEMINIDYYDFGYDDMNDERDYYSNIIDNWDKYSAIGMTEKEIRGKIKKDLEMYFAENYNRMNDDSENVNAEIVSKIVGPEILAIVEEVLDSVKDVYGESLNGKVAYGLALHINNLLERIKTGKHIYNPNKSNVANDYPEEYKIAEKLRKMLERKLEINIPEDESAFITLLLKAIKSSKYKENIGVLVICHGKSVASSMVDVANTLLGVKHAKSINMPLDERVDLVLNKVIEETKKIDQGKGVLLLVDMGSLTGFAEIVRDKTGIQVVGIDKVNTLMVIEATRKSLMSSMNLDLLEYELRNTFLTTGNMETKLDTKAKRVSIVEQYNENLINILGQTLTFLNPDKAFESLNIVLESISGEISENIDEELIVKFVFHCACMIERVIKNDALAYKNIEKVIDERLESMSMLKSKFKIVEETFNIVIDESELGYVLEIIDTHFLKV